MMKTTDPFWKPANKDRQYDDYARTTFARSYPVIADQILERTGITIGNCLEVGAGSASLAMVIALLSELHVTALDTSPGMVALAEKNIQELCMEHLVVPLFGDVRAIPAPDATFHLVISRASYHSWESLPAAFREIYRVLKPGGMAYIGGGFGNARIRDEMLAGRRQRGIADNPDLPRKPWIRTFNIGEIEASFEMVAIRDYRIISDDSGFWMIFRKHEEQSRDNPATGKETDTRHLLDFRDGFFLQNDRAPAYRKNATD